jgi:phosphatidylserine/phosphatidylglycerophosphate/cardiolipin synthase-like enzyme
MAAFVLLLVALVVLVRRQPEPAPVVTPPAPAEAPIQVYFTDPMAPESQAFRGGPDQSLVEAMDRAEFSVDVAAYTFDLWSIRDALLRVHRRGLEVRMVTDRDNILEPEIIDLQNAGIPVVGGRRESLIHHKFVVLDHLEVWTGSMNLSLSSTYDGNNNLIRVRSAPLAEDYTREFEEMFLEDRFGQLSRADTPHPVIWPGDVQLEAPSSPEHGVARRLLALIRGAEAEVDLLAYAFTSDTIAEALIRQAEAGVRVVVEASQVGASGAEYGRLRQAGIDVRLDGNQGDVHHKVILIDDQVVCTGSYNFIRSAEEYNDENVLIVHDANVASRYRQEFERVWAAASP